MSSVSRIMENYFSDNERKIEIINESVPLAVYRDTWEVVQSPERLMKTFSFDSRPRLRDFVSEVLSYEDDLGHHGTIKVDGNNVTIDVYTHDINRITNIDREYAQSVDNIFIDIGHYSYGC